MILFLAEPGPRSHSVYGKHRLQLEKATDTHSDTGAHPATGAHPHTPEPRRRRRPPTRNPPHNGLPQYCQTHTNPAAQTPPPYRQQRIPPHHYARENLLLQRGLVTQKRTFNPGLRRLATPPAEFVTPPITKTANPGTTTHSHPQQLHIAPHQPQENRHQEHRPHEHPSQIARRIKFALRGRTRSPKSGPAMYRDADSERADAPTAKPFLAQIQVFLYPT